MCCIELCIPSSLAAAQVNNDEKRRLRLTPVGSVNPTVSHLLVKTAIADRMVCDDACGVFHLAFYSKSNRKNLQYEGHFFVCAGYFWFAQFLGPHQLNRNKIMNEQNTQTLEIAALEYDVAGVGAVETTDSQTNNAAFLFYGFFPTN
ncbi:MAG: hypothetical protein V4650_07085 [Pseudomonadota bacterium]